MKGHGRHLCRYFNTKDEILIVYSENTTAEVCKEDK